MTQERIWNERLGWLAADGTIEREAGIKKEPPMTTDELPRLCLLLRNFCIRIKRLAKVLKH